MKAVGEWCLGVLCIPVLLAATVGIALVASAFSALLSGAILVPLVFVASGALWLIEVINQAVLSHF